MKKVLALLLALVMVFALVACGSKNTASNDATTDDSAAVNDDANTADVEQEQADEPDAGFEEIPIFEDEEVGFLNVSAVYFQPVPMAPGNENTENYNMHLECDVSAMDNNLGYGLGDWVPYLTVGYKVVGSNGNTAAEGTFMVMSASDGPHYGANIALPDADTYSLTFTFGSPADNGYLIHSDAETGPGGVLEDIDWSTMTVTYDGWEYVPQEW
ncbi:MAG: iron transporter [Oscillospiraceae bacterium]|nr:iron transporter [Oscillospiraceae bacterium]